MVLEPPGFLFLFPSLTTFQVAAITGENNNNDHVKICLFAMKTQSCLKLAAALMRLGVLAIFPALFVSTLSAQDRIVLKNGNTLEAKVQEIQVSEIKYKRFDNLNGPVYSLLKSDVFLIMYENGTKEVISELRAAPAAVQTVKSSNQVRKTQKPAAAHAPKQMHPSGQAWAPENLRKNIVISGISLPLSDEGLKMGFFAGYENFRPLSEKFGITGHASLSYNKLELYLYDYYGFSYLYKGGDFNFRVMAGPSFYTGTGANSSVAFYGTAWLGADYNFFTGDFKDTDKTVSIAYGGGAGLLFGNVFDLGVRILNHTAETGTAMLQLSAGIRF